MGYQRTVVEAWQNNRLFSVLLELTYRCNLDCFFCYNDLSLTGKPMRAVHYQKLLEELASLKCLHLTLSGGEPLAHPDFFEIGRAARKLGFVTRVKSNGHALRGSLLDRLLDEVDPFLVELSLHGGCAETHDRQTRVAGSFSRLMENLETMSERGVRFKINTALTRWNENEISEMFGIADRFGAQLAVDPEVSPRDNGDREPQQIAASPDGLRRFFEVTRARDVEVEVGRQADTGLTAATPSKHCGAGSSGLTVDPYGNVYPCVQWRRPLGNLHHQSLSSIWTTSPELTKIRELTGRAKDVVASFGAGSQYLNFCPGASESQTGDALTIPIDARHRAELFTGLEKSLPLHPSQGRR